MTANPLLLCRDFVYWLANPGPHNCRYLDQRDQLLAETAVLRARINNALSLHQRDPDHDRCERCLCYCGDEEDYTWPCPTAQALGDNP